MKNYPTIVQEIHNEFNTAGDKFLQECLDILNEEGQYDLKKVEMMKSLGFSSINEVKEYDNLINKKISPKKLAGIVNDYKTKFPDNKFINESDVKKICKKYNLQLSGIEDFRGFIPLSNLKEIEDFKANKLSKLVTFRVKLTKVITYTHRADNSVSIFNLKFRSLKKYLKECNSTFILHNVSYNVSTTLVEIFDKKFNIKLNSDGFELRGMEFKHLPSFVICAPKKDMIQELFLERLFSPFQTKFENIPDPVVLYPVPEGYLIVTAWGNEANDPLITQ